MVKIAVLLYSSYNHTLQLSKAEIEGARSTGVQVDVYQIPSSNKQDASAVSGLPIITADALPQYDGYLFGVPTRFGTIPFAVKSFIDTTGQLWSKGELHGKYAGVFVSTGTPNGGQETVVYNFISTLVHHGMIFVPLGYARTAHLSMNLEEIHGGTPWGAATYADADGSRNPTELELGLARIQGVEFAKTVLAANKSSKLNVKADAAGDAAASQDAISPRTSPPPQKGTAKEAPKAKAVDNSNQAGAAKPAQAEAATGGATTSAAGNARASSIRSSEKAGFCSRCNIS